MADMLINLYEVDYNQLKELDNRIKIKKVLAPDRRKVIKFVKQNFNENKGIGKALMLKCLLSMKEMGYAYAIIGSSSEKNIKFHQKVSNAQVISSDTLGIYTRMVNID